MVTLTTGREIATYFLAVWITAAWGWQTAIYVYLSLIAATLLFFLALAFAASSRRRSRR